MNALVQLDNVHRRFRLRAEVVHAVRGVTLELRAGSVIGLIGPSGSGKTTLINLVVGWETPDDGTVVRHASVGDDWQSIAVVPQGLGLMDELSLLENVQLPQRLGNRDAKSPHDLMAELGLDHLERRIPAEASLGEQQRTAVARALVAGPAVLVADEPTSHQDEENAMTVARLLREAASRGSAVLIATHDERVLAVADETIHIEHGAVVA